MANVTKRLLSDQVLFRLYGGFPDVAAPVQQEDIWLAIDQLINNTFRLQQFNSNLPSGETIPDGLSIATYTDITVTSTNGKAKATLPIIPISLPKNIGIYDVRTAESLPPSVYLEFIPLVRGQYQLLSTDKLLNNLLGQVGYTPSNGYITFTQDITLYGVTKVDMDLVVFDMSLYSQTDPLPIPASMEADIVNQLVAQFSAVTPESAQVNLLTNFGQNQNKLQQ
jgi:hypothetical protein